VAIGTATLDTSKSTALAAYYFYDWIVDIGTNTSQTFTIGSGAGNYYVRNSTTEDGTITVVKP